MDPYKRAMDKINYFMRIKSALDRRDYARPIAVAQFLSAGHGQSIRAMIRAVTCGFLLPEVIDDGQARCTEARAGFSANGTFSLSARLSTNLTQPVAFLIGCCTNVERRCGAVLGALNWGEPGTYYARNAGDFSTGAGSAWISRHYSVARDHGVTFRMASTLGNRLDLLVDQWASLFPERLGRPFDVRDMQDYFTGSAIGDQALIDASERGEAAAGDRPDPFPIRIIFE
jgi:hypothetical protein